MKFTHLNWLVGLDKRRRKLEVWVIANIGQIALQGKNSFHLIKNIY